MANLSFDFNKIKRTFYNVKLKDGTIIRVKMPKKKTFEKIQALRDFQQDDESVRIDDVLDTMAASVAECLNNNMNGVTITPEQVAEDYDIEEMTEIITEYFDKFVGSIQQNPN